MGRFAALATTYTFQPFKGAIARMQAERPLRQQERIERARAAAEKYVGWLSKYLHLVSGRLLHDFDCVLALLAIEYDPRVSASAKLLLLI